MSVGWAASLAAGGEAAHCTSRSVGLGGSALLLVCGRGTIHFGSLRALLGPYRSLFGSQGTLFGPQVPTEKHLKYAGTGPGQSQ